MLSRPRGYEAVLALPPNAAVNAAARSVAGRAWRYRLVVVSWECPIASLMLTGSTRDREKPLKTSVGYVFCHRSSSLPWATCWRGRDRSELGAQIGRALSAALRPGGR